MFSPAGNTFATKAGWVEEESGHQVKWGAKKNAFVEKRHFALQASFYQARLRTNTKEKSRKKRMYLIFLQAVRRTASC